jgi:hypothetical protein
MQIKKYHKCLTKHNDLQTSGELKQSTAHLYLFLFIYSLFNIAFSVSKIIQRRMKGWNVSDELESIWKEAVVAQF